METFRGHDILVHDGYMYIFDRFSANKEKKFWRCRYKYICKARIHTSVETSEILKQINEHTSHDSETAKIEAYIAVTKMKKRALETMEPTSNIINECISGLSQSAKRALTADCALKKQIRRTRRKVQAAPDAPKALVTLNIPENVKSYSPSKSNNSRFMIVKVISPDFYEVTLKIKKSTRMERVMKVYCEARNYNYTSVVFFHNRRGIDEDAKAISLNIQDGDVIQVLKKNMIQI